MTKKDQLLQDLWDLFNIEDIPHLEYMAMAEKFDKRIDDYLNESMSEAKKTIMLMQEHCICTPEMKGFYYGQRHVKRGDIGQGARRFTPNEIALQYFRKIREKEGK